MLTFEPRAFVTDAGAGCLSIGGALVTQQRVFKAQQQVPSSQYIQAQSCRVLPADSSSLRFWCYWAGAAPLFTTTPPSPTALSCPTGLRTSRTMETRTTRGTAGDGRLTLCVMVRPSGYARRDIFTCFLHSIAFVVRGCHVFQRYSLVLMWVNA